MSPKIKVLLAFIGCIVASFVVLFGAAEMLFGPAGPSHQRDDSVVTLLIIFTPIAVFIVGALLMWRTMRAATNTIGGAIVLTVAFATAPVWLVFIGGQILLPIASRWEYKHPPPKQKRTPGPLFVNHPVSYADDGTRATLSLKLEPTATTRDVPAFDLIIQDPMHGWTIDRESGQSARLTAVRREPGFDYHDTDTKKLLARTDDLSVLWPVVLKRNSPQTTHLPPQIRVLLRETGGALRSGSQTFDLASARRTPLVILSDLSYSDDGTRATFYLRIRPVPSSPEITAFELSAGEPPIHWMIDRESGHSDRVIATRAGDAFEYQESGGDSPLAKGEYGSIVLPVAFKRMAPGAQWPHDITIDMVEASNSAAWTFVLSDARRIEHR